MSTLGWVAVGGVICLYPGLVMVAFRGVRLRRRRDRAAVMESGQSHMRRSR